ncbi:hypothetical protein HGRIS_010860 [Hohenbuehelia grisea]|uniref:Signal peptidase complex subunit 1 n=1 Tax=Hohenbuehelia grisea TaxID=104357 RepID=A0ABR3IYC3_9AGAR
MSNVINELLEGKIDFEGQRLVETLVSWVMIIAAVISFIAGFALQSLQVTFGLFAASIVALAFVIIPPWPMFNANPVKWLPAHTEAQDTKAKAS